MKQIYCAILFLTLSTLSWGQCVFTLTASDTVVCPGDNVTLSAAGPIQNLLSTLAGGNNHRGNMFSITAINDVIISGFDAHPMDNTTIEIYYKTGTFVGFENNAAAWTLAGSAAVVAQPFGTATPIPVSMSLSIPAGQTYSFYISSTNTAISLNYTNGSGVGNVYSSDANIQFIEGYGIEYPFSGSPFSPRVWNGIIHYSTLAGPSYLWSTGGTTSSINVNPTSSAYYGVEINAAGCSTYLDSVWIDVPSVPVDLGSDIDLCAGDSVTLDAGIVGGTYEWNTNPLDSLQWFTTSVTGSVSVQVTDSFGCASGDQIMVTVHNNPVVDLGGDTTFCVYSTLNLNAGAGFANYLWSNAATSASILLDGATLGLGTYSYGVEVTDNFGCVATDSISVTVDGCASVNALENWGINVYPNPSAGNVYVHNPQSVEINICLYTADGKLLQTMQIVGEGMIDLSTCENGNYLLEINSDEFSDTVKLIKR